jgi:hypothetical protein
VLKWARKLKIPHDKAKQMSDAIKLRHRLGKVVFFYVEKSG